MSPSLTNPFQLLEYLCQLLTRWECIISPFILDEVLNYLESGTQSFISFCLENI